MPFTNRHSKLDGASRQIQQFDLIDKVTYMAGVFQGAELSLESVHRLWETFDENAFNRLTWLERNNTMAVKTIEEYPEIMNLSEVAEFLRVHRTTVQRYAKCGELKSHTLGVRRLFAKRDVLMFFENQVAPEYASKKGGINGNSNHPATYRKER